MNPEIVAADAFAAWAPDGAAPLSWTRATQLDQPAFVLDVDAPYSAVLVTQSDSWELMLVTARGSARPFLGPIDDDPAVVFDSLLYALYARAQHELEYRVRTASVTLARVLGTLAASANDARYGGRAALLLGLHAVKDERRSDAADKLAQAITLFEAARDVTAADTAREALQLLRA
ncbi:hypothetical protein [Agreia sp. COWG]|uniref:hypothetical protein n=1 Tax=Agreia sp. COWG TaxID=2773266 RepID=UPI0019262125|nr:hypothetical protein [Agreia sp. COWG]CAD6007640.1 conserved protein of unknown function [Agreia sp. COWG]